VTLNVRLKLCKTEFKYKMHISEITCVKITGIIRSGMQFFLRQLGLLLKVGHSVFICIRSQKRGVQKTVSVWPACPADKGHYYLPSDDPVNNNLIRYSHYADSTVIFVN